MTFALLIGLLVVSFPGSTLAAEFFEGPVASPAEPMHFGIYSVLTLDKGENNMARVADGFFTAAGPYYLDESNPLVDPSGFQSRVDEAESYGLSYMAHMPPHPEVVNDTTGAIRPNSMSGIPEADLRQHVRNVINAVDLIASIPIVPPVGAWFIEPEELRHWHTEEMNYLAVVADEIHNHDSYGRPATMYNANNLSVANLELVGGQGIDWTVMGIYATGVTFDTRGPYIAERIRRIISATNVSSTTPIPVFELSHDYDPVDLSGLQTALGNASVAETIGHVIRHDVYQGLIAGIRGVQIWSGCNCRIELTTYSEQIEGYISVASDINGELALKDVFVQGQHRSDFIVNQLTGPTTVSDGVTTIPTVGIRDFAYGTARYVFLINSSNTSLNIEVSASAMPTANIEINDLFGNTPELVWDGPTRTMSLGMEPLEVIGLRIAPAVAVVPLLSPVLGALLLGLFVLASVHSIGRLRRGAKPIGA